MATVAASADQAAGLLQNLSLDSQPKTKSNLDLPDATKKAPPSQNGAVDSKDTANGHIPPNDRCITPVIPDIMDPSLCYLPNSYQHAAYYFGGYNGTGNEWDDYSRYVNQEGVEMPHAVYGDNSSLMYHGYGYASYAPYSPATSPVPQMGHDNQLYGHQQYQYTTPYFPPMAPTNGTYPNAPAVHQQGEVSSAIPPQTPLPVETANANASTVTNSNNKGTNAPMPFKPANQNVMYSTNGSFGRAGMPSGHLPSYQDPRFTYDGVRSPLPWSDGPIFSDGQSRPVTNNTFPSSVSNANGALSSRTQNLHLRANGTGLNQPRPISGMGTAPGYMNRMYPGRLYGHYGNDVTTGMGYGTTGYDARVNTHGWFAVDNKFRNKGRGNGFYGYYDNMDGLNELNRGPRGKGSKAISDLAPVTLAVRGQTIASSNGILDEKADLNLAPDREQYNRPDFRENYTEAKFFVIKSYSEDDVHKSIKYSVWSSTPNGNKKLDLAYKEAQEKSGVCPVFLLFSVNTSGQFVGVAEMVGPVDFQKNVEYWQQDKWNGSFHVKWHIVKDVPNSLLKHITLENNENKPVTNSRDTQEVKFEQGLQMLKLFKEHTSKTSILDDFGFYEVRQKTIQEKKAKQQQYRKQVLERKSSGEKSKDAGADQLQDSSKNTPNSNKEVISPVQSNGEAKISDTSIPKTIECRKGSKAAGSENIVVSGVSTTNGC